MSPRVDRSGPRPIESTVSKQDTAQPRAVTGQEVRTLQRQRNQDGFQPATRGMTAAAKLGGAQPATAPVAPATLTRSEMESAQQAIALASDGRDATAVTDWLKANPDPAKQAAFMDLMFQYGPVAGEVLNHTERLGEADRKLLAGALDNAYRSGAVTADELARSVAEGGRGAVLGESHEALGDLVASTGNPDLIEAYAKRELAISGAQGTYDPQRATAAAAALAGLPPERLQAFLKDNPDAVGVLTKNINADVDAKFSPALGKLLDAASRIQPATPESVKLFTDTIDKIGENVDTRAAASRFFTQHADAVLSSLKDASGSLGIEGQKKMSEFFTRTLFSPPAHEGQDALRQTVMTKLGDMQKDLERHANENPPSTDSKREARLMGSLVGALEGGFQIAVEELNQRNEATKGMVDLLFSAKGLLPDMPLPGAGKLKDLTIDAIQDWVTKRLQEKAADPQDAIPFHHAFAELISNPDLRTDYDAARTTAFVNRQRGLA
ncbi:hypothetical protein JGU66_12445 [Myxococcaceae bacterium JPH2]|nr:hypothetical protein [Myxococcaceae bacterium JPH2]